VLTPSAHLEEALSKLYSISSAQDAGRRDGDITALRKYRKNLLPTFFQTLSLTSSVQ
jgi:hypothetical protein